METIHMPFDIVTGNSERVVLTETIPDFFKDYEMTEANHTIAFGSFGHMSFQEWHHHESSISLRYSNSLAIKNDHLIFQSKEADLRLQFALNNNLHFIEEGIGTKELVEGNFNMFYVPALRHEQTMQANRLYSSFSVHFCDTYLDSWADCYPALKIFLNKIKKRQAAVLCGTNQITSIQMNDIIRQIVQSKFTGIARSLYVDIKIKELLMLVLDRVSNDPVKQQTCLSRTDIQRFCEVKNTLIENIQNPMSLKQISRKFGLNTKKIKAGFKQLYQTTPFNLLLNTRMEKAKSMLAFSELDITSIADEIGYDNKHSFSKAFKKYFGYPPGKYRKTKHEPVYNYSTLDN
ncbi:MAG: helix-turn-helix transcriptional regulator [Bacteroidetes bacterium]|nr:helix-turn-helix transcriptional regulator [Bacteroidota bacterium]